MKPITVERAIEILDPEHRECYSDLPDGLEQVNEACRMGMEALKKQMPKKPELKEIHGFSREVASQLCCPSCGKPVINYWNRKINPPHCMMCGQTLDWSEK